MAAQPTAAGQVISETAKAEGGPSKGSTAAEMQSQVTKTRNFEQAAEEVVGKMQTNPASVTSEVCYVLHPLLSKGKLDKKALYRTQRASNLVKHVQPASLNRQPTRSVLKPSVLPQ